MEIYDKFVEKISQGDVTQFTPLIPFIPLILVVYFLPSIISIFRNRSQLKLITLANIPAGLSWFAWLALMAWAISGKEFPKRKSQSI